MSLNGLSEEHLHMLRVESRIADEVIIARGYRTVTDVKDLIALGFAPRQRRVPGLLLPLHTTDGQQPSYEYRPNNPREVKGKISKYEQIRGSGVRVDCPPICRKKLQDPKIPLWATEGKRKADALASLGVCVIDFSGVSGFKGKNAFGGITFLADFDYVAVNGRDIRLIFDSDLFKVAVRKMLDRLSEHLKRKGAHISVVYLPHENGKKCGVDDYLARGHTLADLEALIEGPRPQPQPARANVELLAAAPLAIRRPLARLGGRAYAAIWPYVKVTVTEKADKDGNIITLNPPLVTTEQRLLVLRDDGRLFGDGGHAPLSEIGLTIALDTSPPDDRLWQTVAVQAYCEGKRPDPTDVYRRLANVYDHYLDFNRSLSTQEDMCALSACLSLMTWFVEVFDVLPYPWANGEWGSGKTKWGTIWAATSYLGQVLTLGGSFAALRDLADFGASLLFDDAENIDDKKTDPDKRALLLAGNRRGAKVPLKVPKGDKTWTVVWINAYCPRGFTAKKRPYGAVETRSLVIPLIRTANPSKGNRDPINTQHWPTEEPRLRNDLWATALMLLPEAAKVWAELDKETGIVGRDLEVWRAPLAIARLFERHGVAGLEAAIRRVMAAATKEKREEPSNHTVKVVAAIAAFVFGVSDVLDVSDKSDVVTETFTAEQIVQKMNELADPEEDLSWATAKRLGWVFNSLRLEKQIDTSTKKKTRFRQVTKDLVISLLLSYGLLSYKTSTTSETPETSEEDAQPTGSDDPEAQRMEEEERRGMQEEEV